MVICKVIGKTVVNTLKCVVALAKVGKWGLTRLAKVITSCCHRSSELAKSSASYIRSAIAVDCVAKNVIKGVGKTIGNTLLCLSLIPKACKWSFKQLFKIMTSCCQNEERDNHTKPYIDRTAKNTVDFAAPLIATQADTNIAPAANL